MRSIWEATNSQKILKAQEAQITPPRKEADSLTSKECSDKTSVKDSTKDKGASEGQEEWAKADTEVQVDKEGTGIRGVSEVEALLLTTILALEETSLLEVDRVIQAALLQEHILQPI